MAKRLNIIYENMIRRCYSPTCKAYPYYGGRGITICEEWLNREHAEGTHNCSKGYQTFKKWAIENGYSDDLTIDRIDVNKGYCPENCQWVDMKTQCNNQRSNRRITYKGKTQTMKQWCEELNLNYQTVSSRINNRGFSIERAFDNTDFHIREIEYKGEKKSLKQWCKELNLNYFTIAGRINKYGWTVERAFETKERKYARRK